ncbi:carboxymuconolactone decarboxylase family protein [Saccharospirillum mangrovi]|uniref:carboxymuconolactone decarboxylase family protein n=1 Tax=Saccharospirillum mangrovi TaxID=2161747 RepID=UPI000D39C741|nr:carboxymuconolactone decarboxylase family protein [Saccharospirillum mangrovi]
MTDFTLHTAETAPIESRSLIENSQKAFGRLPGLHAVMAEAPALLEGYQQLHRLFAEHTSFNADELTVVWQTINVEHACHYCVPAHTGIAKMMKVDDVIIDALRDETPLPTAQLEALRTFTLQVVRSRGEVTDEQVEAFLAAGYTKRQILEVILGVAQKVMSNYTNHLADTPVDSVMQKFAWQKKQTSAA